MATQDNWRFCTKCFSLFWYGYPAKGICPVGGTHSPFQQESPTHAGPSWDYELQVASTSPPPPVPGGGSGPSAAGTQGNWRFCTRCFSLFYYGFPTGGVCPAGGSHRAELWVSPAGLAGPSWDYELQVVSTSPPGPPGGPGGNSATGHQSNWRFCTKCYTLFWYGYPTTGACPAGAAHSPLKTASPTQVGPSWDYQLPIASTNQAYLSGTSQSYTNGSGPVSSSATVGSGGNECQYQMNLGIQQDGKCTFSGYYENRGDMPLITAPPQSFVVALFVRDAGGKVYTFAYSGEVPSAPQPGSVAQWNITQNCPAIAENWDAISAAFPNWGWSWYNKYDESLWQWLGTNLDSAVTWLIQNGPTIVKDAEAVVGAIVEIAGAVGAAGTVPRPPLPAGVPTGAAAAAGGSGSGPSATHQVPGTTAEATAPAGT